jgi:hypothetical protein
MVIIRYSTQELSKLQWIPHVPLSLTLIIILLAMHSVFMLYASFVQYSAIIALNSINQLKLVVGTQCVFCETDILITLLTFVLLHQH